MCLDDKRETWEERDRERGKNMERICEGFAYTL